MGCSRSHCPDNETPYKILHPEKVESSKKQEIHYVSSEVEMNRRNELMKLVWEYAARSQCTR